VEPEQERDPESRATDALVDESWRPIAEALLAFNEVDVAILDLFHHIAGVPRELATAIRGDTSRADLTQPIAKLFELRGVNALAEDMRDELFQAYGPIWEFRNIIAHQPFHWSAPDKVVFYNSHKRDEVSETALTLQELRDIATNARLLALQIWATLPAAIKGTPPYEPDNAIRRSWLQRPKLPRTPSQRRQSAGQSSKRPPKSR
jgi:hypothetical protein